MLAPEPLDRLPSRPQVPEPSQALAAAAQHHRQALCQVPKPQNHTLPQTCFTQTHTHPLASPKSLPAAFTSALPTSALSQTLLSAAAASHSLPLTSSASPQASVAAHLSWPSRQLGV